ncbi:unnamed protein product (mitochondrion) [Plasmodiophora brassicae]|uniref:Uncharacterized protein n=1 Tax=Plasmodiophora brassicae TaxID=37360 RepID=A0A3P3YDA4_PLABS|nr:unnamed protein product [Plasmodiophora brassicae]
MQQLSIRRPDDFHLHLRSGAALATTVKHAVRQCARAIVMPNLAPEPVTTVAHARRYRDEIMAHVQGARFQPLMTLYLTDETTVDQIREAAASGIVFACKLYPAGATTHSSRGVRNLPGLFPVLSAMADAGLLLLIHAEVTDPDVDIFDRERVFIERHVVDLVTNFPRLKIVLEHVTTAFAVAFVKSCGDHVAATITPHHLLDNRNSLFQGGLRPHWYCLPILKTEVDRQALLCAATSGNPKFFMGTDSAPHPRSAKEFHCAHAGCFVGFASLELYAEAFDSVGKLDRLEAFVSEFGARFYGLPLNDERVTLARNPWVVPESIPFDSTEVVPYRAGQTLNWSMSSSSV